MKVMDKDLMKMANLACKQVCPHASPSGLCHEHRGIITLLVTRIEELINEQNKEKD